uniref:NADH dehydrogenase I subunit K n=1 Tax=uncultured prokaryote TaxID=198431 RepID=H5SP79_9ZZZZ|nr:NADH dehydrogenase I subunit K [uncultured prokaryote]
MPGLNHYLLLSAIMFSVGVIGFFLRRNAIVILMCIELMLNASNIALAAFAQFSNTIDGKAIIFFVIGVAAAEVAVGISIVICLFRNKGTVFVDEMNLMKQ